MRHSYWLNWKINHGLVTRGRAIVPMVPKGILAKLLYKYYFHKFDVAPTGPRVFKQSVGGQLGPSGDVK